MKTIVVTVGCRPDCIKMMPLVKELKKRKNIKTILLSTGQHKEMLNQVFSVFNETPDYDLSIMKEGQTLFDITENILKNIKSVLEEIKPDV
ncbi:MAG: UDP-N-acetylglucosamine 2-epimerase, partial [Bacilli bacterium]|nr:UDP-N-acetylglucosamine 2-epimerase [Bacilli bacterium]